MPTAKELDLKFGDIVEMTMVGLPRRIYGGSAIGFRMESVKIQIIYVDEVGTSKVMYLEDSELGRAHRGDIHTRKSQYPGFYRPETQSNM